MSCFTVLAILLSIWHYAFQYMSQLLEIHTQARFTSNLGKFRLNQGQNVQNSKMQKTRKNEYKLDRPSCAKA